MPETTETTESTEITETTESTEITETTVKTKERLIGGIIVAAVLVLLIVVLLVASVLLQPAAKPEASRPPVKPTAAESTETEPEINIPANPYGPKDFRMTGHYMTCLAGESVLGIDVSTFQQSINWDAVRESGIEFAMIRLGYRGSEQGLLFEDELAQTHYAGAKAAGLQVGAYFFSQSVSVEEAQEEAQYAMTIMEGWELDMPLVYDWEYLGDDTRTAGMDAELLTDCVLAFCETVDAAGIEPMVYFNPAMAGTMLHLEKLTDYRFWLAYYNSQMTFPYKVDMWQYTSQGIIPGIEGNVDIDLYLPY